MARAPAEHGVARQGRNRCSHLLPLPLKLEHSFATRQWCHYTPLPVSHGWGTTFKGVHIITIFSFSPCRLEITVQVSEENDTSDKSVLLLLSSETEFCVTHVRQSGCGQANQTIDAIMQVSLDDVVTEVTWIWTPKPDTLATGTEIR